VLHGGPGGGGLHLRALLPLFDLRRWRVILYDQRGCGRSTPFLSTRANTTWHLVADLERLREHLGIQRWTLFGGSWGSTLALAYASRHMSRVAGLVLRGICLMEPWENRWLYEPGGVARIAPAAWAEFALGRGRGSQLRRYAPLLRNRRTRRRAAEAWAAYEDRLSHLRTPTRTTRGRLAESLAVLENHYFLHSAWLRPGQLLAVAAQIPRSVPVEIIQGRYDLVCPSASAHALHARIPHSRLTLTIAGHAALEPETATALRSATDRLAQG
jgi:proline iminopeptidase